MSSAFEPFNLQLETIAWLPSYKSLWFSARRRARPARTRLDSRCSLGRLPLEVDFVGRLAVKRGVRATLIIPIDEGKNLVAELVKSQWNEDSSRAFILNGADQTFNNSDTAVFADGPIARWLDALTSYPLPKSAAVEDPVPVADDVLWRRAVVTYRPFQ